MARAKNLDLLHSMRFHVFVNGFGANGNPQLKTDTAAGIPTAGFNACSIPELTQEVVEYREGHHIYTRKYVGLPSVSNITFSRGVALRDGTFYAWIKDVAEGNGEYRADVTIRHFHRDAKPQSTSTTTNDLMKVEPDPDTGYIDYKCFNCFPARNKPAGDLNSTASEVSINELELAVEWFRIEENS
jgi:phage tail-like protein